MSARISSWTSGEKYCATAAKVASALDVNLVEDDGFLTRDPDAVLLDEGGNRYRVKKSAEESDEIGVEGGADAPGNNVVRDGVHAVHGGRGGGLLGFGDDFTDHRLGYSNLGGDVTVVQTLLVEFYNTHIALDDVVIIRFGEVVFLRLRVQEVEADHVIVFVEFEDHHGTGAKISGSNLFTRLNYWIVACGGQPEVTPPTLLGVENPSSATIVCEGETFTFKLDQALADNGGIFLVIEATEGQSNGVSRAHSKAVAIKMVEEPTAAAVDIRADYVAKNGNTNAAAPKIFFRYYYVNSSTGEKSGTMLAECKWTPGA